MNRSRPSETSVAIYQSTRRNIPEHLNAEYANLLVYARFSLYSVSQFKMQTLDLRISSTYR
jgi:hypothetical protein